MKVIPKVTVIDRILADIRKLKAEGRDPECVLVTEAEWAELRKDARGYTYIENPMSRYIPSATAVPDTAVFHTRQFEIKPGAVVLGSRGRDRVTVASYETFMGAPIFVVPDGCVLA